MITYDYFRSGQARLKGHMDLQAGQVRQLIFLSNRIWAESKDNAENGQVVVGFQWLLNLILVDRGQFRVTGFTPPPLESVGALFQQISNLLDDQVQNKRYRKGFANHHY